MKHYQLLLTVAALLMGKGAAWAQPYDFQNTKLKDDKRVELFMKHLTLDEKMQWLSPMLGSQRLGIPVTSCYEGLHGLALGGPSRNNGVKTVDGKEVPNDLPTTIFPQAYGMGCTWDRSIVRRIGEIEAEEVRWYAQGNIARRKGLIVFAPNADLARDPRWGRTEESYGEDPYLVGQLTIAMVKGLQGDNPRYWKTAALMKHFLANSNEDGRDSTSSNFDERLFREYYSYPFYKGITEGGSRAFMASYNSWNGIPMAVHPSLNEIARKEWGNNGIICTDGGAYAMLVNAHHYYPDFPSAAAGVVKAGTSQFLDRYQPYLKEAVEKGLVTEADIDKVIKGNIYVALKLGLLDDQCPYASIGKDSTAMPPYEREDVKQFVREVTAKSIVLLKNDRQTLPIDAKKVKKIAVVGPYADKIVYDWYSGTAPYENTILKAMQEAGREQGIEILYAPDNQFGRAEDLAKQADMVLVCTGNHPYGTDRTWKVCPVPSDGREANDRHSLQLPDEDEIRRLYTINPNTVLVLVSSFPYAINWSQAHLPAILHVTHCSQEQGHGVADVLFGKVNPAGRTTQTWVRDILDLPHMMDYDIRNGRTYMYFEGQPLYPFGYGLSYTRFEYGEAKVLKRDKEKVCISVLVRNTGRRDGDEVVQLYVSYPESQVPQPKRQLKAFERVSIPAGATREVILEVALSDLTYWSPEQHAFIPEKGPITFSIGASSADIRTTVGVTASSYAQTEQRELSIDTKQLGIEISPTLSGIFFEDINQSLDGGICAQMIQNNSFQAYNIPDGPANEFSQSDTIFFGWTVVGKDGAVGKARAVSDHPLVTLERKYDYDPNDKYDDEQRYVQYCVRFDIEKAGAGFGIAANGFGIAPSSRDRGAIYSNNTQRPSLAVEAGVSYDLGLYLQGEKYKGKVSVWLEDIDGNVNSNIITLSKLKNAWQKYTGRLKAQRSKDSRLMIMGDKAGTFYLDFVTLLPEASKLWNDGKDGPFRKDMMEALAALHPKFMRFPGGCASEGPNYFGQVFWKNSIGKPEERLVFRNHWGYLTSQYVGFYEYFLMAESLGASPLPVLNNGVTCQFVRHSYIAPLDTEADRKRFHDIFVKDALDLIEFCNGAVTTTWGKVRAEMGHPAPFNLKYLGIGNENQGKEFWERFDIIYKAVKAQYPDIIIVSTAGAREAGREFDNNYAEIDAKYPDTYVDEHYYKGDDWFFSQGNRYAPDAKRGGQGLTYDRSKPTRVFVGEFANNGTNNAYCSTLAEAAYWLSLERNSDMVVMAAYAPLFCKKGYNKWNSNLIWFDNRGLWRTTNYYYQQLFSLGGNRALKYQDVMDGSEADTKVYTSPTIDTKTGTVYLKFVNAEAKDKLVNVRLDTDATYQAEIEFTTSHDTSIKNQGDQNYYSSHPDVPADFSYAEAITPQTKALGTVKSTFTFTMPENAVGVVRLMKR